MMTRRVFDYLATMIAVGLLLSPPSARAWLDPAQPDVVTVLNSEDNRFTAHPSEVEHSYGASSGSRIKGHQDLLALKFDLSAYRGRIVEAAELHLARRSADTVVSLAASTINTDWREGTGNGSRTVGGPCWRWRVTPRSSDVFTTADNEWTFPRSDFTSAAFGNSGSLVSYGFRASDTYKSYDGPGTAFGWIGMKLDPALVQALILDQYGLAVTDARWHSGTTGPNPTVYTRDQNKTVQPRLYLKFSSVRDTLPPRPVTNLRAEPGPEDGQAVLQFQAPSDPQAARAFGYAIRCSQTDDFAAAAPIARWRIPRPTDPGLPQRALIEDLTPGARYCLFVQAYDAAGNGSSVQSVWLSLPAPSAHTLPDGPFSIPDVTGKHPPRVPGVLRWWAASEVARIDPRTGYSVEDTGDTDDYKKVNAVWNAETNAISLSACRNEVVGAQIVIERLSDNPLTKVSIRGSDLRGPGGATIPADPHIEFFQTHYIGATPEVCIPLAAPFPTTFNIPDPNHNRDGKNQTVYMDVFVPPESVPGEYVGTLTVSATQLARPVTIGLAVRVSSTRIPDQPTFLVDLNGYGNPWNWGRDDRQNDRITLRYFQAAHKHRAVPNTLPYGWGAQVQSDRVPDALTGAGSTLRATSWTTFDRRYGPLFDGSAFSPTNPMQPYHGPGMNTPITHFYSPFFESWPIHMCDPRHGFDAAYRGGGGKWQDNYWYKLKIGGDYYRFFSDLPDVWDAYDEGYKQGLRSVMADWVRHAHDRGWTRTAFETYHNHKFSYNGCAVFWVMEENDSADDFRAVGFWHQLWREGYAQANCPEVKWHFRIDISDRVGLNYGQLDNRVNHWVLGGSAAQTHWPQIKYRAYSLAPGRQETWMVYSDSPSPTGPGISTARLFLKRWSQGFIGSLPYWNAFNVDWTRFPNPPGVIYSGARVPGLEGQYEGCLLSVRAKAMRQAEQLIELLNLWAARGGMNRQRVRDALVQKYGDRSWDYGFSDLDEAALYRLKADLISCLEASAGARTAVAEPGHGR